MKIIQSSCSDYELNMAVAEAYGYEVKHTPKKDCHYWCKWKDSLEWSAGISFCTRLDYIEPLIKAWVKESENYRMVNTQFTKTGYWVCLSDAGRLVNPFMDKGKTLSRCYCFAYLLANGYKIE